MSSFTSIFQLFLSYLLLGFRNVGTTIFRKVEQMFFEDFEASDVASEISIPLNKYGCSSSGDQILDYIFLYTDSFYYRLTFQYLTICIVHFQGKKHFVSCKAFQNIKKFVASRDFYQ